MVVRVSLGIDPIAEPEPGGPAASTLIAARSDDSDDMSAARHRYPGLEQRDTAQCGLAPRTPLTAHCHPQVEAVGWLGSRTTASGGRGIQPRPGTRESPGRLGECRCRAVPGRSGDNQPTPPAEQPPRGPPTR